MELKQKILLALAISPFLIVSGCSQNTHDNKNRPPAQITASVVIAEGGITVSPAKLGAGSLKLIISNQSGTEETVVLEGIDNNLLKRVGPIEDTNSGELKVDVTSGRYTLRAADDLGVSPATLEVGSERQSSQKDLLLP